MLNWLFGAIFFVLDVIAIAGILNSNADNQKKLLWILGVVVFPVIGFVVWFFAGPRMNLPNRRI